MIQPTLTAYSFNGPPEPVLLDVCSVAPDRILLLDAYFSVVVFHGSTIAQWRKAKYQEQEEHKAFADLLKLPREDANYILNQRFPVPRLVDCDQNGSQARFLLAKLNPSATDDSSRLSVRTRRWKRCDFHRRREFASVHGTLETIERFRLVKKKKEIFYSTYVHYYLASALSTVLYLLHLLQLPPLSMRITAIKISTLFTNRNVSASSHPPGPFRGWRSKL